MSSIRDIAKIAGVSIATVSRTLRHPDKVSESTKRKVVEAMQKHKYRPNAMATSFRSAKTHKLLVLVPNLANPFFATLIRGVEDHAQKKGYSVLLGDTRGDVESEQVYLDLVHSKQADGVIQLTPYSPEKSFLPEGIPLVGAAGCEGEPYPSVRIDNIAAAKAVTDFLISQGHRRIAVMSGLADNRHTIDRVQGYRKSLEQHGIEFNPSLIVEGEFTMVSGQIAAAQILQMSELPSAVFCLNDDMAISAMQAFKAAGMEIPHDISIVGFDNIEYSKYCSPSLTTIEQPAIEMGRIAAKQLINLIETGDLQQQHYILPYELLVRGSVSQKK